MQAFVYEAVVVRVIDGDSVVVNIDMGFDQWMMNQNIRFTDIDAPEIRTKDLDEKERGFAAKAFVESNITPGMKVILDSKKYRSAEGKYGRIIGNIWYYDIDGWNNLTEELLKAGHAEVKIY